MKLVTLNSGTVFLISGTPELTNNRRTWLDVQYSVVEGDYCSTTEPSPIAATERMTIFISDPYLIRFHEYHQPLPRSSHTNTYARVSVCCLCSWRVTLPQDSFIAEATASDTALPPPVDCVRGIIVRKRRTGSTLSHFPGAVMGDWENWTIHSPSLNWTEGIWRGKGSLLLCHFP